MVLCSFVNSWSVPLPFLRKMSAADIIPASLPVRLTDEKLRGERPKGKYTKVKLSVFNSTSNDEWVGEPSSKNKNEDVIVFMIMEP